MKKLIIVVASLMVAVGAYGQGQFFFSNRDTTAGVNARFVIGTEAGTGILSSVGTDYTVQLLGGKAGTPVAQLVPLDPQTTTIRGAAGTTLAGYVTPVTVTVPGVDVSGSADVLVKVTGPGGTFSKVFTVPSLGGGSITPPTLPMGSTALSLTPVPEPTTLALGALGLGALLAIRRRKN
jgi:MYXO-CTERM domain-containing protein